MDATYKDTAHVLPTRYVNKNAKHTASQELCMGLKILLLVLIKHTKNIFHTLQTVKKL